MARRLHGLAIVVGALAPAIVILIVGLASWAAVGSLSSAARTYGAAVDAEVKTVTGAFEDVGSALDDVGSFVSGVADDVVTAAEGLGPISPDVALPVVPVVLKEKVLVDLPVVFGVDLPRVVFPETTVLNANSLDFTVPGVEPLGQFIEDASAVSRTVGADIDEELAKMVAVPAPITRIADATVTLGTDVRSTVRTWFMVVGVTLLLVALAWITTRTATVVADVKRGWAMLMSREMPPASIEELRAQVAVIEARLAQLA